MSSPSDIEPPPLWANETTWKQQFYEGIKGKDDQAIQMDSIQSPSFKDKLVAETSTFASLPMVDSNLEIYDGDIKVLDNGGGLEVLLSQSLLEQHHL